MSSVDVILSELRAYFAKVRSCIEYRRTYSNYANIIMHHLRDDFPVEATMKNGNKITLSSSSHAYIITQLQRYKDISFDVSSDTVTISSFSLGRILDKAVKLHGAINNGEVV